MVGAYTAHTENLEDGAVQGLLADQEVAYDMLCADVADDRGLSSHKVRSWHRLLVRHQETVAGVTPDGGRVQVPLQHKGVWQIRPNNPRRLDGVVHQYSPPELVREAMVRFFALHSEIEARGYVVANAVRDALRRKAARQRSERSYVQADALAYVGEAARECGSSWLRQALEQLSEALRATAGLVLEEGLRHAQAGRRSTATAKE